MSQIRIFGEDELDTYEQLLSKDSAIKIVLESLFEGEKWYNALQDANIELFLYCPSFSELLLRVEQVNKQGLVLNNLRIKIVLIAVDTITGNIVSVGSSISFNHPEMTVRTSCIEPPPSSQPNDELTTYMIDSDKYGLTLFELGTFMECTGPYSRICKFTVPYGYINTGIYSNDIDRITGCLLGLKSLTCTTVSWVADVQEGDDYTTMSLYSCLV